LYKRVETHFKIDSTSYCILIYVYVFLQEVLRSIQDCILNNEGLHQYFGWRVSDSVRDSKHVWWSRRGR